MSALCASALDIEEVLSCCSETDVHSFVADLVKYFDAVDKGVLDFVLCRPNLPVWFSLDQLLVTILMFPFRFKLSCGHGDPRTRSYSTGMSSKHGFQCTLLPGVRFLSLFLESNPNSTQITSNVCLVIRLLCFVLLGSLICTLDWLVRRLLQKSVFFLSTSWEVRTDMKDWLVSDVGDKWSVKLECS